MEDNNKNVVGDDVLKSNTVRKKRSLTIRRPRAEGSNSNLITAISSDDIPAFDTNPRRKEFSLSQCISRADSIEESKRSDSPRRSRNSKRSTEGLLAPKINTSRGGDEGGSNGGIKSNGGDGKTKLKLKIGGVSRLVISNGSSRKNSKLVNEVNDNTNRSNNDLEETSEDCDSPLDKKKASSHLHNEKEEEEESMMTGRRKSKRTPKKKVFDSDEDNDDEIRYLEKLKYNKNGENSGTKAVAVEIVDRADEIEAVAEEKEIKRESGMTSRQRALASSAAGKSSAIEFPDGLPPTTRRKKENLTEMEQQVKKAEAAQRRKVQVEKNARESEAEAIRKILGQDSSRKKRDDKNKKRLEELAKEKAEKEEKAATSCIRTIIGPSGTTVSFPIDNLPSLFDPKPVCYPPPKENCAGPGCTNPYKYRHSKNKLPLCSLKCYKAVDHIPPVHEEQPPVQEEQPPVKEQSSVQEQPPV